MDDYYCSLDLSPGFSPRGDLNSLKHEFITFSGGEEHIKLSDLPTLPGTTVKISHRIDSSKAFMQLLLAIDAVRRLGAKAEVFIPYFPYARQDRVMVPGEPFSLSVAVKMLAAVEPDHVKVLDPHSDVLSVLAENLKSFEVVTPQYFVNAAFRKLLIHCKPLFVSPDAGALKRVSKLAKAVAFTDEIAIGIKLRDTSNGKIILQDVVGNVKGRDCLIVDDIIDGGRTFTELAKLLKEKGAKSVYLYVTHGIFSQGIDVLRKSELDGVFTTDSFRTLAADEMGDFVTQFKITGII